MEPFKRAYAEIYDLLYEDKEYHHEVKLIEEVITRHKPGIKRILDYGCGTGNHAKLLASKFNEIYGLDKNEHMLKIARQKLEAYKNIKFYSTSEHTVIAPDSIDVCITVFDVFSYMNSNEEINNFLNYAKTILVNEGLLIFDFWYGPGVINLGPEKRWKEYRIGEKELLRLTHPVHDIENSIVNITHEVIVFEKNRTVNRFTDIHNMRYFFKNEILLFLNNHEFEVLKFGTWKDLDVPPTINDWSSLVVSRIVK